MGEQGGDPACWSHLFEERHDLATRKDVEALVVRFYRAAAMDDVLGPVFAAAHVDWPAHIETLTDFWMWQLFGVRGYEGNPLRAHEPAHRNTPFTSEHFDRWLRLFSETIVEQFEGPTAELAQRRAVKMAGALGRLLGGVQASGEAPIEVVRVSTMTRSGPTHR